MKKYMQSVKSYIDNANLIQKGFLFIGVVAFFVWVTSVKWSSVDNNLKIVSERLNYIRPTHRSPCVHRLGGTHDQAVLLP